MHARILFLGLVAVVLAAGCGGGSQSCAGGERCACYPNGTCNGGLACLSNVCVNAAADAGLDVLSTGAAGQSGTGGSAGGTGGVGGVAGAGGVAGTGGVATGTGGTTAGNGGNGGTAGTTGAGGTTGAAGRGGTTGTGGTTGAAGRGGMSGTGGTGGTAGTTGVAGGGGASGGGGTTGAAGRGGTTGSAGTSGGGSGSTGANCAANIRLMGYAYPPAPACSACKDNQISIESKCTMAIDCLEANYPCSGNCFMNCINTVGGNTVLIGCVNALTSAACM